MNETKILNELIKNLIEYILNKKMFLINKNSLNLIFLLIWTVLVQHNDCASNNRKNYYYLLLFIEYIFKFLKDICSIYCFNNGECEFLNNDLICHCNAVY